MEFGLETARINPLYWWSFLRARHARRKGNYRRESLRHFLRAWQLSGHIDDLLSYALFRRDLGDTLPKRWRAMIQRDFHQLSPQRNLIATNLCLEPQATCPMGLPLSLLPPLEVIQSPAALFCINKKMPARLTSTQLGWLEVFERQDQWRADFRRKLILQAEQKDICVVGNAGVMRDSALGSIIDQHDCVVRFNTFSSAQTDLDDMGEKHTVWVVTPAFRVEQAPAAFSGSIVLTGPDMQYRMLDWSGLRVFRELELPLLTVSLPVWREMVRELAAPPSAGILFLAWLKSMLGSWAGVSVAGFSALVAAEASYHYTDTKHGASVRHNWAGESVILRRWQNEGLKSLHD